jgi:hypothetical protein
MWTESFFWLNIQWKTIKTPTFINDIENIVKDASIKIKNIIIPIRDLKLFGNFPRKT